MRMKTNYMNMDWMIPWLGIAVVAGGVAAAAAYLDFERKIHSAEAFTETLDRVYQNQVLSSALKTIRDGDVVVAAQRLDLLLCDNILALNSGLASANDREAAYVKNAFVSIAKLRPKNPDAAAGAAPVPRTDQTEAEKILRQASAQANDAHESTTVAR